MLSHVRGQFVRDPGLIASASGTGIAHVRRSISIARSMIPSDLVPSFDAHVEMDCAVALAGYVTERRWFRDRAAPFLRPWASPDYQAVISALEVYLETQMAPTGRYLAVLALEDVTRQLLRRRGMWEAVGALASALVQAHGRLDANRANAILDDCLPGPWTATGHHRDGPSRRACAVPFLMAGFTNARAEKNAGPDL